MKVNNQLINQIHVWMEEMKIKIQEKIYSFLGTIRQDFTWAFCVFSMSKN